MSDERLATGSRILCIDGGGIRGLSEILILKELMLQVRIQSNLDFTPEPWQCFDLICGTSTGGLIATFIGRLGKTLDECEKLFRDFGSEIFSGGSVPQKARLIFKGAKHASDGLKRVVQGQTQDQIMYEDGATKGHAPVAVIAVAKTTGKPNLFRSYGVRASQEKCKIVDACLATSAATTFFEDVTVNGITYVDGGFGQNNPSGVTLNELEQSDWLLPMKDAVKEVACFVSIGTGKPTYGRDEKTLMSYITPKGVKSLEEAAALCIMIATRCHEQHLEIKGRFAKAGRSENYYRFDVDRGLESIMLNESDEKALQHISATTDAYLKESAGDLAMCAGKINPRTRGNATRVYFQSFDLDAEDLTEEEFSLHYPSVGFHGQVGAWTGQIQDGVFRVTGSHEARGHPMINTFNYRTNIDGHQTDLRDCIFSVAVKIEWPYLPNNGAGLIVRYVDVSSDLKARGIVFLKEPNRCCSIFYMQGGALNRKASYHLPPSEVHNSDPFDTLRVIASGNRIKFIVNGKVIAEKDDKVLEGSSRVAIIALGQGSFQFDNLELWLTERDENLRTMS